ncbi:MAG TPA: hypothetical protein VJL39_00060 [Candidatus Paceibacterota bacterium]
MENTTPEKRPTDEDEFAAQTALWMGATIFIIGVASYMLATFGMSELDDESRGAMKFIFAIVSLFGALFVGWKPTHEGDHLE